VDPIYDELKRSLDVAGPSVAIDALIDHLRQTKQNHRLFEALTLRAKHTLQLPLAGQAELVDLDDDRRIAIEELLTRACREVGHLFLQEGDVPGAYGYLQMIGELEPIKQTLDSTSPAEEDVPAWIDVALYRGAHPARGVELVLRHYGVCQAITACESLFSQSTSMLARTAAVEHIVGQLHADLRERLSLEIERQEGQPPSAGRLTDWIAQRDWLFEEDNYHVDTSHLQAAIRMARLIDSPVVYALGIELCSYGEKLSPKYRYADPEPFADVYTDSKRYFETLLGNSAEAGLSFFREKAEQLTPTEVGTFPTEVYLSLLQKLRKHDDAIAFVRTREAATMGNLSRLIDSICEEAGDYETLAEWARDRENLPAYLAALLTSRAKTTASPGT
jgi:hypothetical protein